MKYLSFFFIFYTAINFTSCTYELPPKTELVMGTICTVNLFDKGTEAIYSQIFLRLHEIESILSANREDTNVSEINSFSGISPVNAATETLTVLEEALIFSDLSNGLFDPTVGPLVKAWNIGTDYATIPTQDILQKALSLINYKKVIINKMNKTIFLSEKGMKLDLGAVAKGYAADQIKLILNKHNIQRAIIDLGGNVYAVGKKSPGKNWTIGIRDPETNQGTSILTISINDKSVVTSGIYERFFEQNGIRYHHILDIHSGYPVINDLLSVSIITENSIDADALSTTLFLLGIDKSLLFLKKYQNTEAIFINNKHEVVVTQGLLKSVKILDPKYNIIKQ